MARSKSIEKDRGYFSVILKDLAEADSSSAKQIVKMFASAVSVLSSAASKVFCKTHYESFCAQ